MKWVADIGLTINIDDTAFGDICRIIDKKIVGETGGILIGEYVDGNTGAQIRIATDSGDKSKSGPFTFKRGTGTLQQKLDIAQIEGLQYLGEWHCHCGKNHTPSTQDIYQMLSIAESTDYNCPNPILLIFGRKDPKRYNSALIIIGESYLLIEDGENDVRANSSGY